MTEKAEPPAQPELSWQANWCWIRKLEAWPWNQYVYFRRTVRVLDPPRQATVRISADARYALWVNGRRVHSGPARSFPQTQSYDTLDLAPYLRIGDNAICAVCHQFGVPTFQSLYRGASGFLLDGEIHTENSQIPLHTADGWMCRESSARRRDAARLSVQLGFQEHFDADAEPSSWMNPDYEPAESDGWKKPQVLGPVGTHPWLAMEPRNAPLLAQRNVEFTGITAEFTGENARGYRIAADVYHLPLQESRKRAKDLVKNARALLADDAEVATLAPAPDGRFSMIVLDLGQIRTGHITLDIAEAAGDEIIDIVYAERVEKDASPFIDPGADGVCRIATADRYRCRPGAQRWEPFSFKGFRYAALIFRGLTGPLQIRHVGLRQVHAALEDLGSFECSDEKLTRIWRVGRETLRNCLFDAYVDCPWREQAQWWGDARVQFAVNAATFGDHSLLERGIRQVAQSQTPAGALHAFPPSDAPSVGYLPDYMMTWVGSLWDHYFHTGRTDLLCQHRPAMHRLFEFLARHEGPQGLIGDFAGYWVFLDWANLYKENYSAVLNLMYLQSLRWAAAICQVCGDEPAASAYFAKATTLLEVIERYFFDAKASVWRDGFDASTGRPLESISQHANALAMLLRLKPEHNAHIAREVLLKSAKAKRTKIITASPFFYAYILDALSESGFRAECVELIHDKWGPMIDAGASTFWEHWEPKGSLCHAWSASPVYHLSRIVLGVAPVDVGWKDVRIAPLPGKLEFARGAVPSPLGLIRVEWEQAAEDQLAVRIELPPGMRGEFVSPSGQTQTLGAGIHELHM